MTVLAEPKKFGRRKAAPAPPLKELGNDPVSEKPVVVKDGRFGPYVTDGETNASLRKGDTVENVTIERAAELLQIRREAGPAKKAPQGAAKKAAKKRQEGHQGARRRPRRRTAKKATKAAKNGRPAGPTRVIAEIARAAPRNVDPMADPRQVPTPDEPSRIRRPHRTSTRRGPGRQARASTCGCSARRSSSTSG